MSEIIDKRLANALFRPAAGGGSMPASAPLRFGGPYRGLWVGGRVLLSRDGLVFEPNRLNRLLHPNAARAEIPLGDIKDARTGRGFFAGVVEIATADGVLSLRCVSAASFAGAIRQAAGLPPA
jgi:hypothetical protein